MMAIIYNTCSNGSQVNLCIDSSMRSSKLYVVSHRPKRTSKGFKQVIRRSVQKVAEFKVVNSGSCSDPKLSIVLLIKSEKGCYSVKIVLKNSTKVQAVSKLVREPRVHFWWYLRWSLSNVEYLLKIKNMVSAMSEIVKLDAVLSPWYESVTESPIPKKVGKIISTVCCYFTHNYTSYVAAAEHPWTTPICGSTSSITPAYVAAYSVTTTYFTSAFSRFESMVLI